MKLTESQIIDIYVSESPTEALARKHGVSTHTVCAIKRGHAHGRLTTNLVPGRAPSTRHILSDQTVKEIYLFSGTISEFHMRWGVSKRVVENIKFKQTYTAQTENLGMPGEIVIHSLAWDDVCDIRASSDSVNELAEFYGVSRKTIYNILSGTTRSLK